MQVGYRVIWVNEVEEVKAQVLRIFKEKAQILTSDLEKITVPLDELEIAPLPGKKVTPVQPRDSVSLPSPLPDTESSALGPQPHESVSPFSTSETESSLATPGTDTESSVLGPQPHDSVSTLDADTESPRYWSNQGDRRYKPRGTARGKNNYFRFSYRDGGRMRHLHIPGGNTTSPLAQQRWEEVRQMVERRYPTEYIIEVINRWRR